jgi:hypothetical protein
VRLWLGISDRGTDGELQNDEGLVYQAGRAPWAPGQPTEIAGSADCVALTRSGWIVLPCASENRYLCR